MNQITRYIWKMFSYAQSNEDTAKAVARKFGISLDEAESLVAEERETQIRNLTTAYKIHGAD